MKRVLKFIVVLFIIFAGIYSIVFFFVIPQTAKMLVPYKWQSHLLNQNLNTVIFYLGKPASVGAQQYQWFQQNGNYTYTLTLLYNPQNSTGEKCSVEYAFKNSLFRREEVIITDSTN